MRALDGQILIQQAGTCAFDEISLDAQGSCQDCIYLDLPEEQLQRYEREWDGLCGDANWNE
ncbi:hypothetical protein [Ligaoa zhengdingensis]|uniref:hypothetical protein n=1 Tax=Ligaoa zhengdingensis TaxID=2763658 RepID=UPI0031BACE1F